jgi:PKHD-type hydroxylase
MLVCIPNILDAAQLVSLRERLDRANAWVDGG